MDGSKEQELPKPDTGESGNTVSVHEGENPQSDIDSKEGGEEGKGAVLTVDTNKDTNKLILESNNGVDSTDISPQELDNAETLSKSEGHQTEEKDVTESLDGSASATTDKIDSKSCSQDVVEDTSHSNQHDSAMEKESSLKVTVDCEIAQKQTDGANVVHLAVQNETKLVEPSSGDEPPEETLVDKVKDTVVSNEETGRTLGSETMELELAPEMEVTATDEVEGDGLELELNGQPEVNVKTPGKTFLLDTNAVVGDESGTEEEQAAFMQDLETFHKERSLEFKPPRFYGEPLNCLKSVLSEFTSYF